MARPAAPRSVCLLLAACAVLGGRPLPAQDVPLRLWTDVSHPSGLRLGTTMGVSWGDFDADGDADLFACNAGLLWRNLGGTGWELAAELNGVLPPAQLRYGAAFGDFDADGHLDLATAPRVGAWGDDRLHLLRNLGGGAAFADLFADPEMVDAQPYGNTETLCWADVNADRRIDLFVPAYPAWAGGPGNFFLLNAGAGYDVPAPAFLEVSAAAGLDNVRGSARPEGAQFADVDDDGDVDLFSNGILYQNVWSTHAGRFRPLPEAASGIGLRQVLDEGAAFFDYDLDGDQDLAVVLTGPGVKIWENRGDGTFFDAGEGIVDQPTDGMNLGLSAEDWDNDGDVDFTTRHVFRRNRLMEDGVRRFTVATHALPQSHVANATPAWGDWDRDGDLDCALGNWGYDGLLYENTTYDRSTPETTRRHLRLRLAGNAAAVERGVETEFGATAEVHLRNVNDPYRRRKFVASGHGYLSQNDYVLHFALPADPFPADPARDVRFGLSVDFPGSPTEGLWRVDHRVNPVLGDLDLAAIEARQVEVRRCGQVLVNGVLHEPTPLATTTLITTSGGLALPSTGPLPDPVAVSGGDAWVGVAFDTLGATGRLALQEIILDGQLDVAAACGAGSFNVALWDVTHAESPSPVPGGLLRLETSPRNRRSRFATDIVLLPARRYRLVARVTAYRPTAIAAPELHGPLSILGGLAYRDGAPCTSARVTGAQVDPSSTALALRLRRLPANPSADPVGPSLRLDPGPGRTPVLGWTDVDAAGYEVAACDATDGPCSPAWHVTTRDPRWEQPLTSPGTMTWYSVRAVNACQADLRLDSPVGGE